jgi:alanine racemase
VTLVLQVDAAGWRAHLASVRAAVPGLVPVAKGNGYGFGVEVLAREAAGMDVDTLAVGTYPELPAGAAFDGSLLVLSPWRPFLHTPMDDPRLVHTVSRVEDLATLAALGARPRVLVEVETSMHRHGIPPARLGEVAGLIEGVAFEGWSMHLPMDGDTVGQARTLAGVARQVRESPVWLSHVPVQRLGEVAPDVRLRLGTSLWLGAPSALQGRARVLDVHRIERGERFGYRQRAARRAGTLLVVGGGTAHGVGLAAPTSATTLRRRGIALAEGGLAATGLARSPFVVGGTHAWFAEPPHMQCSMVWAPPGAAAPEVGSWLDVRTRHTTTWFDEVVWT